MFADEAEGQKKVRREFLSLPVGPNPEMSAQGLCHATGRAKPERQFLWVSPATKVMALTRISHSQIVDIELAHRNLSFGIFWIQIISARS